MSMTNGVITALPPPEGYIVDFANPERNGNIAAYWVFGVGNLLALLFLAQRFFVKAVVRHSFGFDDVCLVVGWIFSILIQSLIIHAFIDQYLGVHAWEIPITKFATFVKYNVYLNPIIYAPPTALVKLTLLLFYLQINNHERWFKCAVYFTMFVNVGSNIGILFSSIFACNPIAMGWDITITTGTCINRVALFEATAALGVIVDLLTLAIPIPMIVKLQMSRSKKVGLIFMFAIGSATFITSVIRLYLLITALGEVDQPWGGGPISTWILVEVNLLIMCACLPTLRPFFRTVAPGLISSGARSNDRSRPSKYVGRSYSLRNRAINTISGESNGSGVINSKRSKYGRFDDGTDLEFGVNDQYQLETMVDGGPKAAAAGDEPRRGSKHADMIPIVIERSDAGRDDDSERGILQTKSMQVTYEPAHAL